MGSMGLTLRLLLKSLLLIVGLHSFAQTSVAPVCKPPIGRALWHDRLDREQKNAIKGFQGSINEDVKYFVSQSLTTKVDHIQCRIETDTTINDQKKKNYLAGLERLVKNFAAQYRSRQFNPSHFPTALETYEKAMM